MVLEYHLQRDQEQSHLISQHHSQHVWIRVWLYIIGTTTACQSPCPKLSRWLAHTRSCWCSAIASRPLLIQLWRKKSLTAAHRGYVAEHRSFRPKTLRRSTPPGGRREATSPACRRHRVVEPSSCRQSWVPGPSAHSKQPFGSCTFDRRWRQPPRSCRACCVAMLRVRRDMHLYSCRHACALSHVLALIV